jgi:hypothetical protein
MEAVNSSETSVDIHQTTAVKWLTVPLYGTELSR